ncbi:MAG: hypothetical protein Q7S40_21855 [Opitutaceae bacterium]|nr:hypothetical protein [Opitutaceae bacterium]
MELTHENRRTRWLWLVGAWMLLAAIVAVHSVQVRDYIALLDSMGRTGGAVPATPLQRPCPTMFADVQTWVRHALTLLETDAWRIRYTAIDNAPWGREVHWNSAFAWLIAGNGWIRHLFTGEPVALATERALAWFNVPLLLGTVMVFSAWTARRAGAMAGVFVGVAIVCMSDFYAGYAPNYADHHSVLSAANFGVVLGALFMGAGWWRTSPAGSVLLPSSREAARGAAIFSALSGAFGIWVSAASVLPSIAFVGTAGLLATWWQGRALSQQDAAFDSGLWRLWGRLGAAACILFYLLEYAPSHMGWRLEVNHPLFALAWWGGAEIVAGLADWHLGTKPRRPLWKLALPLLAVAAPALLIIAAGTKVFVFRDPFLQGISARVVEGLALPAAMRRMGLWTILESRLAWILAAMLPPVILICWGRRADRLLLGFVAITCGAFLSMAFIQVRFFANAGGAQIGAILAGMVALTQTRSLRWRYGLVLGAVLIMLVLRIGFLREAQAQLQRREITRVDALQPLYRDLAARLRADQPDGDIVLLTNPDASNGIGYYGRLNTIGTLYWECVEGVRAAAKMSAATSMDEARGLLQARRVTHVAITSENNFIREYFEMTNPEAKPDEWKTCFAFQLFLDRGTPLWLERIEYNSPPDVLIPQLRVLMYKTRFAKPEAESAYEIARARRQAGNLSEAEQAVDKALAIDRTSAEFWLIKSEALLNRGALNEAVSAVDECLARAPIANRVEIAKSAGTGFYQKGGHRAAVKYYRASLELHFDPIVASNLAWILATTRDDSLRDAPAALSLARRAVAENPQSYHILSALAAALAEAGQFTDAATAASQTLELARAAGDQNLVPRAEERLRAYQAGRPWRQ